MLPLISVLIAAERDIVLARQRVRTIAGLLRFDRQDQIRIATAVSEIARNAFVYAGGGRMDVSLAGRTSPQLLLIRISDKGRGIPNLDDILAGNYSSQTGMGMGLIGARRLMDGFEIRTSKEGTVIDLKKLMPRNSPLLGPADVAEISNELAREQPADPFNELQRQNQELLAALDELRRRQAELVELNRELEDTNRGVVALYAELDQRAEHLRRADDLKRRFLSNMSHEFRTPLHSILGLTRLLLDRVDGDLDPEQDKQVRFIERGANDLLELVNDLLDLAKVEAGRIDVRTAEFSVSDLFGALRGMLRPLLINERLQLVIESSSSLPPMLTDEGKVSQILRNLIANALKFTHDGEVRVSANVAPDPGDGRGERMVFRVSDTGIGIAEKDYERIFEEFGQVDGPVQRTVKGTGLGLPLSQKLARLLGGGLEVESAIGVGSVFTLTVPIVFNERERRRSSETIEIDSDRQPVLVVDDETVDRFLVEKHLRATGFQAVPAATVREARGVLSRLVPAAIVLDVVLHGEETWSLLAELKSVEQTCRIPIIVVTQCDDADKAMSLGADAFARKPIDRGWFVATLERLIRPQVTSSPNEHVSRAEGGGT